MKILLLNSPPLKSFGIVGQIYPPLGILYLAAYLRKDNNHFNIKVIDGYHEKGICQAIEKIICFLPAILGVSFTTQASTGAYTIISRIKAALPNTLIIAGGAHPTIYPREVLEKSLTDAVVLGEGEVTFTELVNRVRTNQVFQDIAGLAYRGADDIIINKPRTLIKNLDTIPFPARDLINIKEYPGYHYKKTPWDTSFISGRGCPYHCVYCSNPVWRLSKPWFRLRSAQNIADEIEHLKITYNVKEFYDQTDLFNSSLGWAKRVCDEYIKRDLNIFWKVQMTVHNIDEELAQKMVKSGCWLGLLGIETGNDITARGINKRSNRSIINKSLTFLKKYGMKTFALLMAFNVWEEDGNLKYEDMEATLNTLYFVKQLIKQKKIDLISWSLTTPYPGSDLFNIAKRHRLIDPQLAGRWEFWDSSENFIMHLPGVRKKDWQIIKRKGKLLQARLLLMSGTFNIRSIPVYFKKAWSYLKSRLL